MFCSNAYIATRASLRPNFLFSWLTPHHEAYVKQLSALDVEVSNFKLVRPRCSLPFLCETTRVLSGSYRNSKLIAARIHCGPESPFLTKLVGDGVPQRIDGVCDLARRRAAPGKEKGVDKDSTKKKNEYKKQQKKVIEIIECKGAKRKCGETQRRPGQSVHTLSVECGSSFLLQIGGFGMVWCSACLEIVMSETEKMNLIVDKYMLDRYDVRCNYSTKTLLSLLRCRLDYVNRVRSHRVLSTSTFSNPIAFHVFWMEKAHNILLPRTVKSIISSINMVDDSDASSLWKLRYVDDIVRKQLSSMEDIMFKSMNGLGIDSYALRMLYGLSTCGGPRSWTEDQIHDMIDDWVGARGGGEPGLFESQSMLNMCHDWCISASGDKVQTFDVFQTDAYKWATSGGAPVCEVTVDNGVKIKDRSKWGWFMSKIAKTSEIYASCVKEESGYAGVALKEEKKTRIIITTPMSSYIRQSYILYVLGRPSFLKSTIADESITERITGCCYKYFLCIDASKFDHSISKDFVILFWRHLLSQLTPWQVELGLPDLISEEIRSLMHLKVKFKDYVKQWENGLLSGWRVTSLIGSIKSQIVCLYIMKVLGLDCDFIVQGDDIIIMTNRSDINLDEVVLLCQDLGIQTNSEKTTYGRVGEFLKYTYERKRVSGLPCRTLRSIFYANPWLDTTAVRKPEEVVQSWYTYWSRFCVISNMTFPVELFKKDTARNVFGWLGGAIRYSDIISLLDVPLQLGGLGVYETMDMSIPKLPIIKILEQKVGSKVNKFFESFGLKTGTLDLVVKPFGTMYLSGDIMKDAANLLFTEKLDDLILWDRGANVFRTVMEIALSCSDSHIFKQMVSHTLGFADLKAIDRLSYPSRLREKNKWIGRVEYYTKPEKVAFPTSMFVDARYDSGLKRRGVLITKKFLTNSRRTTSDKSIISSMYICTIFSRTTSLLHSM